MYKIEAGALTYRHHTAKAHCMDIGDTGAVQVTYSGMLDGKGLISLRHQLRHVFSSAHGLVISLDKSLTAMSAVPIEDAPRLRPAAYVVRPDQYSMWEEYAAIMARLGALRVVFLPDQLSQARAWAARHAVEVL